LESLQAPLPCRIVVLAQAGTHGKTMQDLCFLLTWMPAFAHKR